MLFPKDEAQAKRQDSQQWGKECEQLAADYLLSQGYLILERNWTGYSRKYEIDIIARIGADIVFVEVKARKDGGENPLDAVDGKKMRQMVRAADSYLGKIKEEVRYRFDIITFTGSRKSYRMKHYPDAFLSPFI